MKKTLAILLFILSASHLFAQYDCKRYPVIPRPYELLPFDGDFHLNAQTVLVTDNKILKKEIEFFRQQVKAQYGIDLKYGPKDRESNVIFISSDSSDIPAEGYFLFINRREISVYGGKAGIFYGLQTLLQLIHEEAPVRNKQGALLPPVSTIPSCSIIDYPRFTWRGMHLDVSRHFFPKENIKEYLRWMAAYKFNTFHWHLTDDQGWRIEIKKYPKLTSVGAWRKGTLTGHYSEEPDRYDTITHGGFYTQNEIREIVRYADSLHITIVPEIEMPGHTSAMLAAYPELGCTEGPFKVERTWGVFDDVLCPTEKTFSFLDDVLTEVAALFPGKYIHIGGDECPKKRWKESAFCQDLIQKNKLKDEHELQSWFTQRIVKMLAKKNKMAIGWDEILEGGLPDGTAVMSWRGEEGGIAAAKAGHYAVMSPGSHCYFDHYQSQNSGEPLAIGGFLPIEKVYSFNPVPAALNAKEQQFILGAQANLWTEYIAGWKQVQYMIFPRMLALAEVNWSLPQNKDYYHFSNRLLTHFTLLDNQHILYSKSYFDIQWKMTPTNVDAIGLMLWSNDSKTAIRYSFSEPVNGNFDMNYEFTYPIVINKPLTVYAASFSNGVQVSQTLKWEFVYNLATGKPVSLAKAPNQSYNTGGPFSLVDGRTGEIPWKGSDWLGWWGDTLDATIDLGKDTIVHRIRVHTLSDHGSWIYEPGSLNGFSTYYSSDGKTFHLLGYDGTITPAKDGVYTHNVSASPVRARYIRIVVTPTSIIPSGSPGEGNPGWLFVSEIEVN